MNQPNKHNDAKLASRSLGVEPAGGGRERHHEALLFFVVAFANAAVPMPALAGLVAAAAHMARQIKVLDIDNPEQCLKLFHSNKIVGWLIFLGLMGGGVWATISPSF